MATQMTIYVDCLISHATYLKNTREWFYELSRNEL